MKNAQKVMIMSNNMTLTDFNKQSSDHYLCQFLRWSLIIIIMGGRCFWVKLSRGCRFNPKNSYSEMKLDNYYHLEYSDYWPPSFIVIKTMFRLISPLGLFRCFMLNSVRTHSAVDKGGNCFWVKLSRGCRFNPNHS